MRFNFCATILSVLMLTACEKDEIPVDPPHQPGELMTAQIPMGQHYEKQYFFDLKTGETVSSNDRTAWDLAFESGNDGYHIVLNSAKFMFAWNTGSTDFYAITDDSDADWQWDVASGNLDSTAIGEWGEFKEGEMASHKHVYLIDRGKYISNEQDRIKKIIFEKLQDDNYFIKYASLDGSSEGTFQLGKDDGHSLVYFSFDNGQVTIAPEKNTWDLVFTTYTHLFTETPSNIPQPDTLIPYLVTGVLQNRYGVAVMEETKLSFNSIQYSSISNYTFEQNRIDEIGYDWKLFNFDEISYTIVPRKNYIIKDTEGFYYKLHFIDFYSDSGEKGYPKFEYQRL